MRCHLLRMLKRTPIGEIGGDRGRARAVIAVDALIPAAAARRRIVRQASHWTMGFSERAVAVLPRGVRKR